MRKLKLTRARQVRFLKALAETGSVATSAALAGTSRTRVYELRKADPAFASAWEDSEEIAADRLEEEARRRAVEGVEEPLVRGGKLVHDDSGQPITVRRYSDNLLLALLKAHRPPRRERPMRFQLKPLRSAADAAAAIASMAAAVAAGDITPSEAAELSALVEAFLYAIETSEFDQRLQVIEDKHAKKDRRRA
ncbi:MAG: hypothetical protein WA453_05320 [Methyloceanibacter sp.]